MLMTPEEFVIALTAIHKYLKEKERPIEIKETPKLWKISARVML
ncbi:MAG: hypothetical protein RMH75_04230 [Archaeoglobaceae archaeon]|nr:hypothetical protein [Archaeoglobaceae archaeon]MDW7989857.1 hypothetical protein [Archaeoglobaceae archaeon]